MRKGEKLYEYLACKEPTWEYGAVTSEFVGDKIKDMSDEEFDKILNKLGYDYK